MEEPLCVAAAFAHKLRGYLPEVSCMSSSPFPLPLLCSALLLPHKLSMLCSVLFAKYQLHMDWSTGNQSPIPHDITICLFCL